MSAFGTKRTSVRRSEMSALLLWLLNDLALGRLRDAAMAVAGVVRRVNCEFGDRDAGRNHKVREAETRASNLAAPATLAEKSVHRKREFQAALRLTLGALRVRDPSNKVWSEALHLLENPQLRIPSKSH